MAGVEQRAVKIEADDSEGEGGKDGRFGGGAVSHDKDVIVAIWNLQSFDGMARL